MFGTSLFLAGALMAQAPAPPAAPPKKPPAARTPATAVKKPAVTATQAKKAVPVTDEEKTIYALGLSIARSLTQFNLSPAEMDLVKTALSDAAAGKPAVELDAWGPKIQGLAQARGQKAAERQKAASEAYLSKAAAEPGVTKTASGLIYKEMRPGTGGSPKATDTVKVNYRGTLIDGTEFDSSYKRGQPAQFALNAVIPCWTEGVQRMKVGEKATLVCPSQIAYGERGNQGIPGGAALIFEIELLEIAGGAQ